MTTLYLVRHAEAMGNINEVFQGRTDCDITERGIAQLEKLSERFKDIFIDRIYSSPLIRTYKTAQAVNKYHGLEIIRNDGLVEINGGLFEGQKFSELGTLFPREYNLWCNDFANFDIKNGESTATVYSRMKSTIEEILVKEKEHSIACISHGCAIKCFLCYANGISLNEAYTLGWSDNTAVSKLIFDKTRLVEIVFQNDNSHLDENTSTIIRQSWWKKG